MSPGSAVDLHQAVHVAGLPPPHVHFYLTDVSLQRTTVITAPLALFPGYRLVKRETVVPRGIPERVYESAMNDAMTESQSIAAAVGERAAGYRVPTPPSHYVVERVMPGAPAQRTLRAGDEIRAIGGRPVTALDQVHARVAGLAAGSPVAVTVLRSGRTLSLHVGTNRGSHGTQFGVLVAERSGDVHLPRDVRFDVGDVGGSSGGLMFALDVFASLRPREFPRDAKIAGTGTIALDGKVGPIEGTVQKLIAAKRAGATVFLCPPENCADVANDRSVRVLPVRSFAEAVRALKAA